MKQKIFFGCISAIVFTSPSFCQQTRDYKTQDYSKLEKTPNAQKPLDGIKILYGSISGYISNPFRNKTRDRFELAQYKLYIFEIGKATNNKGEKIIGHKIAEATITTIDGHLDSARYLISNIPINKVFVLMFCYVGDRSATALNNALAIQTSFFIDGAGISIENDCFGQTYGLSMIKNVHVCPADRARNDLIKNIIIQPL